MQIVEVRPFVAVPCPGRGKRKKSLALQSRRSPRRGDKGLAGHTLLGVWCGRENGSRGRGSRRKASGAAQG